MNRQPPRGPKLQAPQQAKPQRLSPGVYRMANGSLGNGKPQAPQRQAPQAPPMQPQGQPQSPYGIPRPQFNPQEQMQQGQFNPQLAQQMAQQYQQDPNGYSSPQGGGGQGYSAQLQGGGYNPGGNPQQTFDQAAQQNQQWRKTQQPAQPMGILAGYPKQGY